MVGCRLGRNNTPVGLQEDNKTLNLRIKVPAFYTPT
jgi:hypothetical protein